MKSLPSLGIVLFLLGTLLMLERTIALFVYNGRKYSDNEDPRSKTLNSRKDGVRYKWVLVVIVVGVIISGALLRLQGLGERSMSHPEVYVPGIPLPKGISEPPPRLKWDQFLWWQLHTSEPHPPAYYSMMFLWTKVFGTGLFALRLPSVIFGLFALVAVFYVAKHVYDLNTGILSMALMAFNGHQIYWSQMARMYAMLCFLGLLSTLLLLKLLSETRRRHVLEPFYVAVSVWGLATEIFFWPFLATQIIWTIALLKRSSQALRVLSLQTLIVILGAPLWAYAIYRAKYSHLLTPTLAFVEEYFSFGFLFEQDQFSLPVREQSALAMAGLVLFALALVLCAFRVRAKASLSLSGDPIPLRKMAIIAIGPVLMIVGMSLLTTRRSYAMLLAASIPFFALGVPATFRRLAVRDWPAWLIRPRLSSPSHLILLLAFVPALFIIAISFVVPLTGSRMFILFTPFLLILIAKGVTTFFNKPALAVPLCVVVIILHVASISYFRNKPSDSRDYQELAHKLTTAVNSHDLIFVHRASWVTTPLFYYLHGNDYDFVASDFNDAVSARPNARVWLILFGEQQPTEEMESALSGFTLEATVSARRGRGLLFTRNGTLADAKVVTSISQIAPIK